MKRLVLLLLLAQLVCSGQLIAAVTGPAGALIPTAGDKCPVCGMFVARYPNWVASSRFKDGTTCFFDGPKDMFTHYFHTRRYSPGRVQADIVALAVKEYYTLKTIDARQAYFVVGSNVKGPMGGELIPFATKKDAAAFMADHKGKRLLRFPEITPAILNALQ